MDSSIRYLPLASAGLIAVLAPAGAAGKSFFSVAENYTIRYYPRFMTYFQQSIGALNQIVAAALRPNWLPVPHGPFGLLLRTYGPTGNTSPGANIPPKIRP